MNLKRNTKIVKRKIITVILFFILFNSIFFNIISHLNYVNYFTTNKGNIQNNDFSDELTIANYNNNYSISGAGGALHSVISSNTTHMFNEIIEDIENNPERKVDLVVDNNNWNITKNNFTIGNIKSNATEYIVEDYPSLFIGNEIVDIYIWMSIKIPVSCILNKVKVFVQESNVTGPGPEWQIMTFNATRDPRTFLLRPDSQIAVVSSKIAYNPTLPDPDQRRAAHWETFVCDNTGGQAILDINNTYKDTYGNGYYFISILLPRARSIFDPRYVYINSDIGDEDNGYLIAGTPSTADYIVGDLCLITELSPTNTRPKPSEIGLGIENLFRPDPRIDVIENQYTEDLGYIYNTTFDSKIIAQNFTFNQEGILNNISLFLNFNNSDIIDNIIYLGIVSDSGFGIPVINENNQIIDVGFYIIEEAGITDQWITFQMFEQPFLTAGMYWWIIFANTTGGTNITAKGYNDTNGDDAKALNGTNYSNSTMIWNEINGDFASKIGWHPGLEVIPFNDKVFNGTQIIIENETSEACSSLKNITSTYYEYVVASQNFTIPGKGGLLNNISLRLKSTYDYVPLNLIIYESNGTRPDPAKSLMYTIILASSNESWHTFKYNYSNGLDGGEYWWVLIAYTNDTDPSNNVTIYGVNDTFNGNNAVALNGTISEYNVSLSELPVDYACIIGWEPAPKGTWLNDTRLYPDEDEKYHYTIKSRWMGAIYFELNITNTIESFSSLSTQYAFDITQDNYINWNSSITIEIPAGFNQSIINITKPKDWKVLFVKKDTIDYFNYEISSDNTSIKIKDIENGSWLIQSRSNNYPGEIVIYKEVGGTFTSTSEVQIYDNITINATIYNQKSGTAKLGLFYPYPNNFTHYEESNALDPYGNATFKWKPESDPLAIGGVYTIAIEWNNGTEVSFQTISLLILPTPTNLTIINNFTRFPYIDDDTQFLIIKYNDSVRGNNISGALLNVTINGPQIKSLEWDDLYSITQNESKRGLYKIKIDTTNLPINDTYSISIKAYKVGYSEGLIQNISLKILPVPVQLISEVLNITQYIDERINFKCSYKDTFHKIDIDWAQIQYKIVNTSITGNMSLSMPGESIYETSMILLTGQNITGNRMYKINITAIAENCSTASVLIDLYIKNKTKTKIVLNPAYPIPAEIIEGQSLTISIFLINDTNEAGLINETIKFSFGGGIPDRIARTDSNGMALIELIIPTGITTLNIYITYEGSIESSLSTLSTPITISVISFLQYIGRYILWILIGVVAVVSIVLIHKYTIVKPRKARKTKRLTKIANKFRDIANLQFLMVIHRNANLSIFNYSIGDTEFDPVLVSGFFGAIGSFEFELSKKVSGEQSSEGFELSYSKYKILVMGGELTKVALITETTASVEIREKLQEFLKRFETVYRPELEHFMGNVNVFKTAGDLVKDIFELNLTFPQILTDKGKNYLKLIDEKKQIKDLSKLEIALLKIMNSIMISRNITYFFIPLVISMAQAARPESDIEIIGAVYNLIQKKIIESVEFK
ncbi:MAG: hypothetical protein ACTSPY_03685 [Candidatus Helarchaeota archaeon]